MSIIDLEVIGFIILDSIEYPDFEKSINNSEIDTNIFKINYKNGFGNISIDQHIEVLYNELLEIIDGNLITENDLFKLFTYFSDKDIHKIYKSINLNSKNINFKEFYFFIKRYMNLESFKEIMTSIQKKKKRYFDCCNNNFSFL